MYQREVEIDRVVRVLDSISRTPAVSGHVAICFGTTLARVADDDGVEVIYLDPAVKGLLRYIPVPKPKFFITRVNQSDILRFFRSIESFVCITVMIFPANREDEVVEDIINNKNPFFSIVNDFKDHFIYFADTDNPEMLNTGISEARSIGRDSPFKEAILF